MKTVLKLATILVAASFVTGCVLRDLRNYW